ncbi:MAG: hypothetical protein RL023_258 [Candidatus Parcubacteria bacterium]|jgi:hypothetical protein
MDIPGTKPVFDGIEAKYFMPQVYADKTLGGENALGIKVNTNGGRITLLQSDGSVLPLTDAR